MLVHTSSWDKITQPGFFFSNNNDVSFLGLRFTPAKVTNYLYHFNIQTQSDTIITKSISFEVIPSKINGFLSLNPESDYTSKFDSELLI